MIITAAPKFSENINERSYCTTAMFIKCASKGVQINIASVMSILFLDNVVIDVFVIGLLTVTSILSIF